MKAGRSGRARQGPPTPSRRSRRGWHVLRLLENFVARLGTPVPGLPSGLTGTFPDPAAVTPDSLARIGLPEAEATAIAALAGTLTSGQQASARSDQWRPWLVLAAAHLTQTALA